jgi:importin-7
VVATHILPEFSSKLGFMRWKAAWAFSLYSDLDYKNLEIFETGFTNLLRCMDDPELPVRIGSAIGLRFAIGNDHGSIFISGPQVVLLE